MPIREYYKKHLYFSEEKKEKQLRRKNLPIFFQENLI